jgi:hypothetical protein
MHASNVLALVVSLAFPACAVLAQDAPPPAPVATMQSVTAALRALVPAGVTVAELRQEGDEYVFTGASATNAVLSDFMRKTMSSPGFSDVELREIAQAGSQYRYEMSIEVDCSAEGASKPGAVCGAPAKAQSVHKCRINGTLTFQAAPCPAGSEG